MALNFDTRLTPTRPGELYELANCVLKAGETDESDWIEWKSRLDDETEKIGFQIARQILGMSNRMPESAKRNCEGLGYVFFGLEPGLVHGFPKLDPSELTNAVDPYVGSNGPSWQHHYLDIDNLDVLAIIVSAPQPGDKPHPLRKRYDKYQDGAIFVRKNGKTEPAKSGDIDNLSQRNLGTRLKLSVSLDDAQPIPWFEESSVKAAIVRMARGKCESMLQKAHRFRKSPPPNNALGGNIAELVGGLLGPEERSLEQFEREVHEWQEQWCEQASNYWLRKYIDSGYGVFSCRLENLTERNFSNVRVILNVYGARIVQDDDILEPRLPQRPLNYGQPSWMSKISPTILQPLPVANLNVVYSPSTIYVENLGDHSYLEWDAGDLRPKDILQSEDFFVIVDSREGRDKLAGYWEATATSTDGVNEGALDLCAADAPVAFDDIDHELETAGSWTEALRSSADSG